MQTIQHDRLAMDNAFEGGGGCAIGRGFLGGGRKQEHETKTPEEKRFGGGELKPDC